MVLVFDRFFVVTSRFTPNAGAHRPPSSDFWKTQNSKAPVPSANGGSVQRSSAAWSLSLQIWQYLSAACLCKLGKSWWRVDPLLDVAAPRAYVSLDTDGVEDTDDRELPGMDGAVVKPDDFGRVALRAFLGLFHQ